MMRKQILAVGARLVAAAMLAWSLADHEAGYFRLLRLVVCGVAVHCAVASDKAAPSRAQAWKWAFVVVALLFNPFLPVHLDRGTWKVLDVAAALGFLVACFDQNSSQSEPLSPSQGGACPPPTKN